MERTYHFLLCLEFLIETDRDIKENNGRDDAAFDVVCDSV